MATSKAQKNSRKKPRYDSEDSYDNDGGDGGAVSIIPTPSIDLVLQSLATNALVTTTPEIENEEQNDAIHFDVNGSIAEQQQKSDRSSSKSPSSASDFDGKGGKKLRRLQTRACRQRVSKWKVSEAQRKQLQKIKGALCQPKSSLTATEKGLLFRLKQKELSAVSNSNSCARPLKSFSNHEFSTKKNVKRIGGGEMSEPAKTAKTLSDLLQYSKVVAANLGKKTISPSSKNGALSASFASDAAVQRHPSSSKSIATLITDRFRPNKGTFYRYTPPAPLVTPAAVHKLILNARQTTSTIDATLNSAFAKSVASVLQKRPSAGSSLSSTLSHPTTKNADTVSFLCPSTVQPRIDGGGNSSGTSPTAYGQPNFYGANAQNNVSGGTVVDAGEYQERQAAAANSTTASIVGKDDDVVVVHSSDRQEDETDQGTADSAPFCKNCASEIPLILKNLDRLDNIVTTMITSVEQAIRTRQKRPPPLPNVDACQSAIQFAPYNNTAGPSSSSTTIAHLAPEISNRTTLNSVFVGCGNDEVIGTVSSTNVPPPIVQQSAQNRVPMYSTNDIGGGEGGVINIVHHIQSAFHHQSSSSATPLPEKILDDDNSPPRLKAAFEEDGEDIVMLS